MKKYITENCEELFHKFTNIGERVERLALEVKHSNGIVQNDGITISEQNIVEFIKNINRITQEFSPLIKEFITLAGETVDRIRKGESC